MGKLQCNGGLAIVPICTESDDDPNVPELLGSGILVRFGTKSFLLTAAHVLEAKKTENSLLVPSSPGKMAIIQGPGMTSVAPNSDRKYDHFDCAWIELNSELSTAISQSHKFLGVEDIALDDSSLPTDHYCLTGYPICRSRIDTSKDAVKMTLLNFNGYAASEKAYRKSKTSPTTHIAAQYSKGKSTDSRGVRTTNDNPHGLSGGALWKWVRLPNSKTELRFLFGIIVEWDEQNAIVIGTKIAFLIESIRVRFPELSPHLPRSNTVSITCVEHKP